jgi:hypothetical protein
MRIKHILFLAAAAVLATTAARADAAPCAGFEDVDSSDPFCANVEWIRNRFVTFGCTSTAFYCPAELVRRDSMALFLRRLGNALTDRLEVNASNPSLPFLDLDSAPQFHLCETSRNFSAPYPLRGRAYAIVDAAGQFGSADIFVRMRESPDNGVTWIDASPMHAATLSDGFSSRVSVRAMTPPRDIPAGAQYKYVVAVGRLPGSTTTGDLGEVRCEIIYAYNTRNSLTSPLDAID